MRPSLSFPSRWSLLSLPSCDQQLVPGLSLVCPPLLFIIVAGPWPPPRVCIISKGTCWGPEVSKSRRRGQLCPKACLWFLWRWVRLLAAPAPSTAVLPSGCLLLPLPLSPLASWGDTPVSQHIQALCLTLLCPGWRQLPSTL